MLKLIIFVIKIFLKIIIFNINSLIISIHVFLNEKKNSLVSKYVIPIGIPQVDGWSTRPSMFRASQV